MMENKIISIEQYKEVVELPLFMAAHWILPSVGYLCSYCGETKGNVLVTHCTHCGANLAEGYRFVGGLDKDLLFVKESEFIQNRRETRANLVTEIAHGVYHHTNFDEGGLSESGRYSDDELG